MSDPHQLATEAVEQLAADLGFKVNPELVVTLATTILGAFRGAGWAAPEQAGKDAAATVDSLAEAIKEHTR